MKTFALTTLATLLLAGSSMAGTRVFVNFGGYGGCGPRTYAPPICYAPRVAAYCPAPVAYYRPAPVYYYSAGPVVYAPAYAPVYRAPIVTAPVTVSTVSFGWRR